jgi:hypothetical protein
MVGQELKGAALRKDDSLVVDRTIVEMENEATRDPVAAYGLDQVAVRERLSIQRSQGKKTVRQALRVTHGNDLGGDRSRKDGRGQGE